MVTNIFPLFYFLPGCGPGSYHRRAHAVAEENQETKYDVRVAEAIAFVFDRMFCSRLFYLALAS